ncbi:hypothetical protein [Ralstonia pseudosolanacearum]|uniref:hypothetical protein n=1 Tax=Ralstonia pseudosolanacearum TaxID=1310165 RepID=UPI00083CE193|nr:hypothetical protein [Ralstonia pseudosolanacearum]AOE90950.1 hypothetical protein LBM341_02695 [Ralstonia solanacearum]NKA15561.1 hypothetical protein [Ralstonia solanacearum]NKA50996.1 hypothetical protein [Ralstonia solanacearum]UYR02722.1 hypothetical protein NQS37_04640 [Ralstonia pseudosolanacearum]UYR11562.1 hypothetical protein NQS35_15055 [Ralstonia pseudosolanacearum]
MLTLNDEQWQALQAYDARHFVMAVRDQFVTDHPAAAAEPGGQVVLDRMLAAYDHAERLGFTSTPHVAWLLYLAADAPAWISDPVVDAFLRERPGTPEQRLDDMAAVMQRKLEGGL